MAQALKTNGYQLFYWTSDSPSYEVDFVIQKEGHILPIEVKSGENTQAKSLNYFQKRYAPQRLIRLSEKNFGSEGGLRAVPLYAAFCI